MKYEGKPAGVSLVFYFIRFGKAKKTRLYFTSILTHFTLEGHFPYHIELQQYTTTIKPPIKNSQNHAKLFLNITPSNFYLFCVNIKLKATLFVLN